MGCNQSSATSSVHELRVSEIPCTPEEIGKYLNKVRANP